MKDLQVEIAAASETQKAGMNYSIGLQPARAKQSEELRKYSDRMRSGIGAATLESCSMSCIPPLMQNEIKGE